MPTYSTFPVKATLTTEDVGWEKNEKFVSCTARDRTAWSADRRIGPEQCMTLLTWYQYSGAPCLLSQARRGSNNAVAHDTTGHGSHTHDTERSTAARRWRLATDARRALGRRTTSLALGLEHSDTDEHNTHTALATRQR